MLCSTNKQVQEDVPYSNATYCIAAQDSVLLDLLCECGLLIKIRLINNSDQHYH
jgi:hypothetical protein